MLVKQVVDVIWRKGRIAAAHGLFNRSCQVAPMCTQCNTCFLGPESTQLRRHIGRCAVHCSQSVRWIKMKLGMQMGLGREHIVLDGDPLLPQRGTAPIFGPHLLWPNVWMDQDATWYGGRPRPRRLRVRWWPRSLFPEIFGPCLLWPNGWMDQDGT